MGTIHRATILDLSMTQLGHNPYGYNLVNYQRPYHWARSP